MTTNRLELQIDLLKPPSLNAYYAGGHWTKRKKAKDENLAHITRQFEQYDEFTCDRFEIDLAYNSRYDCDNSIVAVKFLSDAIVSLGICPDDNKKHFQKCSIKVNTELPSNTFIASVKFFNVKPK